MMSYDPSSLNRNKTLLEAIEEVKKFLIANPCYKVFYANTNYVIGTTTYSKTYIDDPDSMAEYDVVFFNNNYYGKVESVGDSTFTIIGATNFKGDTGTPGTPGTPGADGQDGISITNVSIDASNHLICTLSNGTTIDAGEIPGGSTRIISLASGLSGTLTQDEYDKLVANDFNYVIEMGGNFYHKANLYGGGLNAHYTCVRKVSSVETWASDINIDSTRAWTLTTNVLRTKIQNAQIDSGTASSGQVLTANGSGGASWENASGGAVEGTDVLSTGEANNFILTSDGNGGAIWKAKYWHNVKIVGPNFEIHLNLVRAFNTQITSFSLISSALTSLGEMGVSGFYVSGSTAYNIVSIAKKDNTSQNAYYHNGTGLQTLVINSGTITDTVSQL